MEMNTSCCGVVSPQDVIDAVKKNRKWLLWLGVIMIVLGWVAVVVPNVATFAIENLIGWLFAFGGMALGVHAFYTRKTRSFVLQLLGAFFYVIAGIVLFAYPLTGVITLTVVLAVLFTVGGIFRIAAAFQLRNVPNWGWLLLNGIITLILGILIWTNLPGSATWVLGLIVGIDMLFTGFWMVMFSMGLKKG